ncbi:kynureninase [Denitrobaculum tricleocarpae]|uniref:Kynureninase n=1 Tax=Denitrobaculum tricleocarpae TaxID=2591009 RepID=A0A545TU50_9PROT|nr:kynureninase [Denitrobaculum tricleocarpae]TQV80743.1 kynureninase [Denitrobaculum tricleocarpae]
MSVVTREDLLEWDRNDPLGPMRAQFRIPAGTIYLDGNSLGPMPRTTPERVAKAVEEEWGEDLIRSWNKHGWIELPQRCGAKIADLIGAAAHEVVVADSTSVNLFKLLAAALRLRPDRRVILSDTGNFPTDLYVAQGLIELLDKGHELRLVEPEKALEAIDDSVALVMLTQTDYRSGRRHNMAEITSKAHGVGALVLWDLAHSAGAFPVDLRGAKADFAVGCGYKYLNGGPGAPAFLFVAEQHQNQVRPPLSGWMGHEAPFQFDRDYRPAAGISRNLCGTPAILSMTALDAGLDILQKAGMTAIREKSVRMTELFIELMETHCADFGFELFSPRDPEIRGSQVSFRHQQGYPIMAALIEQDVIGDFRAPDILRFGFTPLYLRYGDIWDAVQILRDIMTEGSWDQPKFHKRQAVT